MLGRPRGQRWSIVEAARDAPVGHAAALGVADAPAVAVGWRARFVAAPLGVGATVAPAALDDDLEVVALGEMLEERVMERQGKPRGHNAIDETTRRLVLCVPTRFPILAHPAIHASHRLPP